MQRSPDKAPADQVLVKYADIAWQVASAVLAPPLMGLAAGSYLDGRSGSRVFTVVLLLLGVATGVWSLVKMISKTRQSLVE